MANLINIEAWSSSKEYVKNSVTYLISGVSPINYYAIQPSFNVSPTSASGSSFWTTEFTWKPSYSTENSVNPKVINVQFGDGYSQRQADGLNNTLSSFNLVFENRDEEETKAINAFIEDKGGYKSFDYALGFYKTGKYIAQNLRTSFQGYNNYNISATFTQVI